MKRLVMVLWMALVAGFGLFTIACDDDDDTSSGDADADGDTDADSDSDADSDTGGGTVADPFADYKCAGMDRDVDPCGYDLCSMKSTWDRISTNDCGNSDYDAYCESILGCFQDYVACFETGCPPGTAGDAITSANVQAISDCSTNLSTCMAAVPQPGQ